jgi:N-methylhydantoinase B
MVDETIDPVQLQVIWSRLQKIPQEMGVHLRRTAFSQVVKYAQDFSTGFFTGDGRLISQGVFEPGFIGCMPYAMQEILENHYPLDTWKPGDIVITNDPYIAAGHFPDIFTFEPVFFKGELAGFAATVAHHADIGGKGPGSGPIDAANWYEEGLQLPPLKLYEGGEPNQAMLDTILQNVRVPDEVDGDLQAQRAAGQVGKDRYTEVLEEYGLETVKRYMEEILDRSERTMRESIEDVPDGSYDFEETIDGVDEPLPMCVELRIDGDELTADFEGTADQLDHYALNATPNVVFAKVLYSVKALLDSNTPNTDGSIQPIHVELPERSLVNPDPPVPLSKRHVITHHMVSAINGAFAQALPGQVPACGGHEYTQSFNFVPDEDGNQQILIDIFFGGAGARPERDGRPAVGSLQNITNTPIETIEADYPLRIKQYGLVMDSAGAGRYRGGSCTVRDHEVLRDAELQSACERFKFGTYGLEGGQSGRTGAGVVNPGTDEERSFFATERLWVEAGDVVRTYTPGGGGFGNPRRRDPGAVRDDVENGIISPEKASETYGVDL